MAYPPNSPPPLGSDDEDDDFGDFETVFDQQCSGNDAVKNRIDFDIPASSITSSSLRSLPPDDVPPFSPDFVEPSTDRAPPFTPDFTATFATPTKSEQLYTSPDDSFSASFHAPFATEDSSTSRQLHDAATEATTSANLTCDSSPEQAGISPRQDSIKDSEDQDDVFADFSSFSNVTSCNIDSNVEITTEDNSGSPASEAASDPAADLEVIEETTETKVRSEETLLQVPNLTEPSECPQIMESLSSTSPEAQAKVDSHKTDANVFVPDFTIPFESVQGIEDLDTTPSPVKNSTALKSVFSWDSSESETSPNLGEDGGKDENTDGQQCAESPGNADEFDAFTVQPSTPGSAPFAAFEENAGFQSNLHIDTKDNLENTEMETVLNQSEGAPEQNEEQPVFSAFADFNSNNLNTSTNDHFADSPVKDVASMDVATSEDEEVGTVTDDEDSIKPVIQGNIKDDFSEFSATPGAIILNEVTGDIFADFSSKDDIFLTDENTQNIAESLINDHFATEIDDEIDLESHNEDDADCKSSDSPHERENQDFGFADFSEGKNTPSQDDDDEELFTSVVEEIESGTSDIFDNSDDPVPAHDKEQFSSNKIENDNEFAKFTDRHSAQQDAFAAFPSDDDDFENNDFDDFAEFETNKSDKNNVPAFGGFANFDDYRSANSNAVEEDDDFDDFTEFDTNDNQEMSPAPVQITNQDLAQKLPLKEVISACFEESSSATETETTGLHDNGRHLMGKVNEVDAQFAVGAKWITSPSYMRMINTLCLAMNNQQPNKSTEVKPAAKSSDAFDVFGSLETTVSNPISLIPDDLAGVAETKTIQPARHADILSAYTKPTEKLKLSREAQVIVDTLPDLSFMLSPVLMFPVKG